LIYGIRIEPFQLEVKHLYIDNGELNKVLKGKTAIHLSDLHIGKIGKREKQVLQIVGEIRPDFIFLTGDYIPWNGNAAAAIDFLSKLKAAYGVWAVMGDYDYSNSRQSCVFCHSPGSARPSKSHQVTFLRNKTHPVHLPQGTFLVGGVDEDFAGPFATGADILSGLKGEPGILLCHNPLMFDYLDEDQNVVMLAGDTHGGQLPLPAWLWNLTGYEKNAKYNQGWFKEGKKRMYVSRGIGTSHWPIRILRRPELVVLHF
jgi:predicted MPP superfamily phosphohydrolase